MRVSPSASEEPLASNVQARAAQLNVKDALGAVLPPGAPSLPGVTARENWTPRLTDVEVVATRVPEVGPASGPLESARTWLILPLPVPSAVLRDEVPAGRVQVVAALDFSPQMLTSHEPVPCRATEGALWLVADVFTTVLSESVTLAVPTELR